MAQKNFERMATGLILLFLSVEPLVYGESGGRIVISDGQIRDVELLAQYRDDSLGSRGENRTAQVRRCIDEQRSFQSLADRSSDKECRESGYRRRAAPLWMTPGQRARWSATERRMAELYKKQSDTRRGNAAREEQLRQFERERADVLRQRRRAVEWEVERGISYPAKPLRD